MFAKHVNISLRRDYWLLAACCWLLLSTACRLPPAACAQSLSQAEQEKIKQLLKDSAARIKTMKAVAVITSTQLGKTSSQKLKFFLKSPNKFRAEFLSPASVAGSYIISDGKYLYRYMPSLKKAAKITIKKGEKQEADVMSILPSREILDKAKIQVVVKESYQYDGKPVTVAVVKLTVSSPLTGGNPVSQFLWMDISSGIVYKAKLNAPNFQQVFVFSNIGANVPLPDTLFTYKGPLLENK